MSWMDDLLGDLRARGLLRTLRTVEPSLGAGVVADGRRLVNFGSNDYLGLSRHPALAQAAAAAGERYGAGAGASRLVTGNHPLYERLEGATARGDGRGAVGVRQTHEYAVAEDAGEEVPLERVGRAAEHHPPARAGALKRFVQRRRDLR